MASEPSMVRRLTGKLGELLAETETAAAPASSAARDGGSHLAKAEFEIRLRTLLRGDRTAPAIAGRVNFIGLARIREKLGDRWPHTADLADRVARKAIERRLTEVDVYTRYQDLQYLIIFAQLTKEQAQIKCRLIAEEIAKNLLGEDVSPELLEVKTMVAQLDGSVAFEEVPNIATLVAHLSEPDQASGDTARPTAPDIPEEDAWWLDGNSENADPLAGVQLVYRPMWDVKRNAITTYLCAPALPGPAGRLQVGEAPIPRHDDPAVIRQLDLMVQRRVITDLRKLVAEKRQLLLCLPVHFETLASITRRKEYLELCQRGIPPLGLKLLVFELMGLPDGVPRNRLIEIASILRRFGRHVLMRTEPHEHTFFPPAETGIVGVGFHNAAASESESHQIQDMERYAVAAKKAGLVTYVHGLPSISLTTGAIGAGFDFVDGDIVKSVVDQPLTAYGFEMSDLFTAPPQ